jgi:hypothetical protein
MVTAVFQDKQNAPEAIWMLDFRIATQTARTEKGVPGEGREVHHATLYIQYCDTFV